MDVDRRAPLYGVLTRCLARNPQHRTSRPAISRRRCVASATPVSKLQESQHQNVRLNVPFVIVFVPVAPEPACAGITKLNVPVMVEFVSAVMLTVPLPVLS
jgi:hypothetical protein